MQDPTDHENSYVIVDNGNLDSETGKPLFWSNDDGWVDFESSTIFSEAEMLSLMLPMGSQVEWMPFWDAVNCQETA